MASLALMALGSSLGWGQTALTIAGLAGSFLDQAYIMPALFPVEQQKYSTGKIDDLQLQSASEGQPINRCYGDAVPCYGEIIWLPEMIEVINTEEEGGKGGGGVEYTTYAYYQDMAVGVCKGPRYISHIWADSKLIYLDENLQTLVTLTGLVGEINVISTKKDILGYDLYPDEIEYSYIRTMEMIFSYGGEEDLPPLEVGRPVALSGAYIYDENHGVFNLLSMTLNEDGNVVLLIDNPNAVEQPLSGGGMNTILSQDAYVITGQYESLAIYKGDEYNVPDPTIESYKGVGNVPAYNGLCYVVFHRLKLADYGNRPPNLKFLVRDHIDQLQ